MKMKSLLALSLILLAVCGAALAQDKAKEQPMGMSHPDMQAMEKSMSPGEQHKQLARMAGDWTFTNKAWMAPGQPPMESSGTMHADVLMGGRYVEHHWKGSFMNMPFEGRGTEAYDNITKQYVNTWIDTMGTGIMTMTGTCEDAGKKCTYNGMTSDPMAGKAVPMREVITWLDADTFTNEMFGNDPSGKEMKWMEITAKRAKK
jgi:Protein of unknown function (DUF1579)